MEKRHLCKYTEELFNCSRGMRAGFIDAKEDVISWIDMIELI